MYAAIETCIIIGHQMLSRPRLHRALPESDGGFFSGFGGGWPRADNAGGRRGRIGRGGGVGWLEDSRKPDDSYRTML